MSNSSNSPFSAVDPTLGYLYQIRCALLWSLRRLKAESAFLVSIETLDDVTFEPAGADPKELFQTKHHRKGIGSLSDASTDLWKTLRIWFEGSLSGQIPSTANLFLVSTATAASGTAASKLKAASRDVASAQQALDATAASSTSKDNKSAYAVYLKASGKRRTAILNQIVIIDAAPQIADLDAELKHEVYWAAGKDYHSAFLDRLEGWWVRRALRQIIKSDDRIGSVEIETEMSDLREQFKQDSLPIDDDLLEFTLDNATKSAHENTIFVKQIEITKAGKKRIAAAIRDYYRAFEQRSRWLRDDLVVGIDLHKYENRLAQEWELIFEQICDEMGASAAEEAKEKAARSVLAWAERISISIRPSVTEPFVCRGSLHMLADDARIGWHPEYKDKLAALLSAKKGPP